MQVLGISAFDKPPVKALLTEVQVNQNFKEQYDLFNNQFLTHQEYVVIMN
jgi:hypothetical protein